MRTTKKELIYLNINDLSTEEIARLGDFALNACDKCGEIDLSTNLNWIEGEDFYDDPQAQMLVRKGFGAVCECCLKGISELRNIIFPGLKFPRERKK